MMALHVVIKRKVFFTFISDHMKGSYNNRIVVTDGELLTRASEDVADRFPHLSFFIARWLFIVTWHNVTFYGSTNPSLVTVI